MAGSTPALLSAEAPVAGPGAGGANAKARRFSPTLEAWRRFRRHKLAVVSAVILLLLIAAIAVGPLLWRVPINEIDFTAKLEGPSWNHPFGTDDLGQDVLARLIYGGRISLAVGL
ncbi:MAG: ABC transporter permease, partial [Enhydrobacter sp.]